MFALILGTPDSGKSARAEELAVRLAGVAPKYYLATMEPYGVEGARRVEKHRKMREGKGFTTIERTLDVEQTLLETPFEEGSVCLLECVSNLVANELFRKDTLVDKTTLAQKIVDSIFLLARRVTHLVVVSNSFRDDGSFDAETREYARLVEEVNVLLRQDVDRVDELVDGKWVSYEVH